MSIPNVKDIDMQNSSGIVKMNKNETVIIAPNITENERQKRLQQIKKTAIQLWISHLKREEIDDEGKA